MADIDNNNLEITSITITSDAPTQVSVTEDGLITQTYSTGAQSFGARIKGITSTHAQWAEFYTKMIQLSNAVPFTTDIHSYKDIFPVFGTAVGTHQTNAAAISGASEIVYDHSKSGVSAIGDFIKFKDANYSKLYQITGVNTTTHKYTIFPVLREAIADDTEILYGADAEFRGRVKKDTFSFSQNANFPTVRDFNFDIVEDYTPTT